mmetsp:Transcript_98966/g.283118  ORF Transcript_98966/g.283118 Transcript_98966/m.283118 type:complete len:148 (-) Transcript_98966:92-535(-)
MEPVEDVSLKLRLLALSSPCGDLQSKSHTAVASNGCFRNQPGFWLLLYWFGYPPERCASASCGTAVDIVGEVATLRGDSMVAARRFPQKGERGRRNVGRSTTQSIELCYWCERSSDAVSTAREKTGASQLRLFGAQLCFDTILSGQL